MDRNEAARQVTVVMALLSPKLRTNLDMHTFHDMSPGTRVPCPTPLGFGAFHATHEEP